jgi:hypothetical protein
MKFNTTLFLFLATLVFSGCYEEPKAVSDNFTITPSQTSVEANGLDAARINLQIDASRTSNVNARTITVTTNLGYFGENKQALTSTVTTDATGKATVYLKSEQAGNALVQANIGTLVYRSTEVAFSPKVIVVNVTAESASLEADGISTSRIKVEVAKANTTAARTVTVSTTIGTFANGQPSITLTTDPTGSAYTHIKSDVAGRAILTAGLGTEASAQTEVQFTPKTVTMTLTSTAPTIEADGVTTSRIDINITKAPIKSGRTITLTTNLGTFSNGQPSITLTTNELGTSFNYLKGDQPGRALLTATLGSEAIAIAEVILTPKIVTLTVAPSAATSEADGVTSTKVLVTITKAISVANRAVTLTTTVGTFTNSQPTQTLVTASDGTAYTYIKSDLTGKAIVTATLANETVQQSEVLFTHALPGAISVSTDVLEGTSGAANLLTVTVQLNRTTGKPSTGFIPVVQAFDNTNSLIGNFTAPTASGPDGRSTVKFAIPDKTFVGPVTFRATLQVPGTTPLTSDPFGPVTFKAGI